MSVKNYTGNGLIWAATASNLAGTAQWLSHAGGSFLPGACLMLAGTCATVSALYLRQEKPDLAAHSLEDRAAYAKEMVSLGKFAVAASVTGVGVNAGMVAMHALMSSSASVMALSSVFGLCAGLVGLTGGARHAAEGQKSLKNTDGTEIALTM